MVARDLHWLVAPFALVAFSCSSGSGGVPGTSGGTSGGSSGSSGGPIVLPSGETIPTLSCGLETLASATGTWDVVASTSDRRTGLATITIIDGLLSVISNNKAFLYDRRGRSPVVGWSPGPLAQDSEFANVARTEADLDVGVFPFSLGGEWVIGSSSRSLTLSIRDGSVIAEAKDVLLPSKDWGGLVRGTARGTRREPRASVFGALGGVWELTGVDGSGSMTVVLEGTTFTAIVNSDARRFGKKDSWVTVKVCGDRAVGRTSLGVDVAAVRR